MFNLMSNFSGSLHFDTPSLFELNKQIFFCYDYFDKYMC